MDFLPILRTLSRNKLRFVLIAGQMAISLAIGANCVALVLDAREKVSVQLGYDDSDLVVGGILVPKTSLRDDMERNAWVQKLFEEMRALPGVRSVSSSNYVPWAGSALVQIRAAGTQDELVTIGGYVADEFFLDTIGLALDEGRWFTPDEVEYGNHLMYNLEQTRERLPNGKARQPLVGGAVITRALGQRLFGNGPLLGRQIEDQDGDIQTIIGVVREFNNPALKSTQAERHARFVAGRWHIYVGGVRFVARAQPGKADELAQKIGEWVNARYDDNEEAARTADEMHAMYFGPERMLAALMTFLVCLLLMVTSLGIAGITSFSITERTRQMGTRRALGATATDILLHCLTESAFVMTIGLLFGAGFAVLLNMALLRAYDTAKLTPTILAACALLLFLVALGAAFPPARRASKIPPAIATRNV